MKRVLFMILSLFIILGTVNALTVENVTLSSTSNNASVNTTKAINVSTVELNTNDVTLTNFSFENGDEWLNTTSETNISSLSEFVWDESNSLVDTQNFLHYFRFNLTTTGTLLSNWTFNSINAVGDELTLFFTDLGSEGSKSWEFSKFGYVSAFYDFVHSYDSFNNVTFNVTPAKININIYDRDSGNLITDNVSVELIGDLGALNTTTTGTITFESINRPAGDYQVIASTTNYETESIYFTYTNEENLTANIYMINSTQSNIGVVNILVKDSLSFLVEGATVNLLEWKSSESAYVSTGQCQTVSDGTCTLNIELNDKLYKFQAVKDGVTKTTNSQILTQTDTTVPITLEDITLEVTPDLDNFVSTFTETIDLATNISTTRFEFTQTNGLSVNACITSYKDTGFSFTQLSQNCTTSSSGILYKTNSINNSYDLVIRATVEINDVTYNIGEFTHKSTNSFGETLAQSNLDILLPVIFVLIGIGVGIFFGNIYISLILIFILEWLAVAIVPTILSVSMAIVISVITILTFWGVNKK